MGLELSWYQRGGAVGPDVEGALVDGVAQAPGDGVAGARRPALAAVGGAHREGHAGHGEGGVGVVGYVPAPPLSRYQTRTW